MAAAMDSNVPSARGRAEGALSAPPARGAAWSERQGFLLEQQLKTREAASGKRYCLLS